MAMAAENVSVSISVAKRGLVQNPILTMDLLLPNLPRQSLSLQRMWPIQDEKRPFSFEGSSV